MPPVSAGEDAGAAAILDTALAGTFYPVGLGVFCEALGIGTVARQAQVSARMLRHYHEFRLFTPAYVDAVTGHRHRTPDQVRQLRRILLLRISGCRCPWSAR